MFRMMLILLASYQIDIQDVIIHKDNTKPQPKCECQCVLPDKTKEEEDLETNFGYSTIQFKKIMRSLGCPMILMYT
jgi:hypothetical protein